MAVRGNHIPGIGANAMEQQYKLLWTARGLGDDQQCRDMHRCLLGTGTGRSCLQANSQLSMLSMP